MPAYANIYHFTPSGVCRPGRLTFRKKPRIFGLLPRYATICYHMPRNERKFEIMIKILFVCHGNICRSPMAEFVLKDMVTKQNISHLFHIASCATSTEEIWNGVGNPVYPPAKKELAKHGISCEGKRAVQLRKDDYGKYDYLICMDSANVRNSLRILGGDPENKIKMCLEFAGISRDVADPWYTGRFETTYNDVVMGCEGLLEYLRSQGVI